MKPLRVLVFVKNNKRNWRRDNRLVGWWSHDVPDFTWEFQAVPVQVDTNRYKGKYDLIAFHDCPRPVRVSGTVPTVALIVDSTGSTQHYTSRRALAGLVDMTLVDHDELYRFRPVCKIVERCSYCVNDLVFKDYKLPKVVDIANHMNTNTQGFEDWRRRNLLVDSIREIAQQGGYSYRESTLSIEDYARSYNEARVGVNFSRTARNRPHRTYDVIAAKCCLVTTGLPSGAQDRLTEGVHYLGFDGENELGRLVPFALSGDRWQTIAEAGYAHVHANHTWRVRAAEMRQTIHDKLGV